MSNQLIRKKMYTTRNKFENKCAIIQIEKQLV